MEEDQKGEVFQTPTQYESRLSRPRSQSSAKKIIIIVTAIVVLGLLIFGVNRFLTGGQTEETPELTPSPTVEVFPTNTPEPTPEEVTPTLTPKPTNTPTPKPTSSINPVDKTTGLDRSKLSIRIKNGSGVTGAAKKAGDILEALGYNIIQIGNADNSDYAQTEIQISSAQNKYLDLLKKDLSANYTVGSTSNDKSASESADAIVIIGKQ